MLAAPTPSGMALPEAPAPQRCGCSSPLAFLRVAVIAKYGGKPEEAAFKFLEDVAAIQAKNNLADTEPTLTEKLDALKAEVGAETYEKLLANPEVERMASRAFRRTQDTRIENVTAQISALLNNALDESDIIEAQVALSQAEDEVAAIVEA